MKRALAVVVILATPQNLAAETSYICVAESIVGFKRVADPISWLETEFETDGAFLVRAWTAQERTELTSPDEKSSHGLWSHGGETGAPLAHCTKRTFAKDITDISCRGAYAFSLSLERLTYQLYYNGQYSSQKIEEHADSLYVETGSCSIH